MIKLWKAIKRALSIVVAAPDLLAACEQALHCLERIERRANYHSPKVTEILQKAIAKATGQNEEASSA